MEGQRPQPVLLAGFSPREFIALTSAVSVVAFSCGTAVGAQTIEGDVSSVAAWQAPGVVQSRVLPVDGRSAAAPVLVPSSSVHFVDSAKAPAPVLLANPAIRVTNERTEAAPKILVDPRVTVSDDSKAGPPPAPVNKKVQVLVSSAYVTGHDDVPALQVSVIYGSQVVAGGDDVLAANVEIIDGSNVVRHAVPEGRWPVLASAPGLTNS